MRMGLEKLLGVVSGVQEARGCPVWCVIHTGAGHVCGSTVMSLFKNRDAIGRGKRIDLLVHSPGGHPELAYKAMKFFRRRFAEVNIIVPLQAKSAATLMCLGADHVYLGEFAELGPIDIQIDDNFKHGTKNFSPLDEFKSIEFMREQAIEWMDYYAVVMNGYYGISLKDGLKDSIPLVSGLMRPIFAQIDPIEMGEHRRALAISEHYAKRMVALVGNPNATSIVRSLVWDYPSHDFCIDVEEAKQLGLPVESLPTDQDKLLTTALLEVENDETSYQYHGFAPPKAATNQQRPVRQGRRAGRRPRANGQANGAERPVRPT